MCFLSLESLDPFSYKEIKQRSVTFLQPLISSSSKFRNRDTIISIELPVILRPLRIRTLKLSWKDLVLIGPSRTEEHPVELEGPLHNTTSNYQYQIKDGGGFNRVCGISYPLLLIISLS